MAFSFEASGDLNIAQSKSDQLDDGSTFSQRFPFSLFEFPSQFYPMRAQLARRVLFPQRCAQLVRRRDLTISGAMRSDGFASEEYLRALSRLGLEGNLFHSKENLRKAFIELNAEVELDDVSGKEGFLVKFSNSNLFLWTRPL